MVMTLAFWFVYFLFLPTGWIILEAYFRYRGFVDEDGFFGFLVFALWLLILVAIAGDSCGITG